MNGIPGLIHLEAPPIENYNPDEHNIFKFKNFDTIDDFFTFEEDFLRGDQIQVLQEGLFSSKFIETRCYEESINLVGGRICSEEYFKLADHIHEWQILSEKWSRVRLMCYDLYISGGNLADSVRRQRLREVGGRGVTVKNQLLELWEKIKQILKSIQLHIADNESGLSDTPSPYQEVVFLE